MELGWYDKKQYTVTRSNTLIVGKPKTGKTTLLERLALDDIFDDRPIVFFGNAEKILERIPPELWERVLYFNPAVSPFAFNVLADIPVHLRPLIASTLVDAIIGLSGFSVEPARIKKYMRYGIATLLEVPGTNFLHLNPLLTDDAYRTRVKGQITDPVLKTFWRRFDQLSFRDQVQFTESTLTRLDALLLEPLVRNCLFQRTNKLSFKDRIVLVSLKESELGRENANLLGALVLASLYMSGVQGVETTLYVDEANRYGSPVLTSILTGCPSITTLFSLQSLSQMKNPVASRTVAFQTTIKDAELLQPELRVAPGQVELNNIHPYTAYVKENDRALQIYMPLHEYERTYMEEKIKLRCARKYTSPIEHIQKRLGGLFK